MYITPVINRFPCFSGDANIDNNCFMENREQQILSEIKSMVASIRSQLERLDAKMVEFHQAVDPEGFKKESINVIIDDIDMLTRPVETEIVEIPLGLDIPEVLPNQFSAEPPVEDVSETETPVEAAAEEITVEETLCEDAPVEEVPSEEPMEVETEPAVEADDDDLPFGDIPAEETQPEPVSEELESVSGEPEPETVNQEPVQEEDDDDDLPGFFSVMEEPVTVAVKASAAARPTINDAHSTDQAWRKDMPGSPVKDIRSAISLNDRVFFINNLFNEDAQAFVNTLSSINSMASLDEVVEFVTAQYPDWNLNSEIVYRFMMAVRRKVN